MSELGPVQWSAKGHTYTPDDPCMFVDRCTPFDASQWVVHAAAWVAKLEPYVGDRRDRMTVVEALARWHQQLADTAADCSIFSCHVPVSGLTALAQAARNYLIVWSAGQDTDAPNTDPWSLAPVGEAIGDAVGGVVAWLWERGEEKAAQAGEALLERMKEVADKALKEGKQAVEDNWGWVVPVLLLAVVALAVRK